MSQTLTDKEMKFLNKLEVTRKNKLVITSSEEPYDEENDLLSSKIAGVPYWPESKKDQFPTINGEDAKLVIQLNLTEMSQKFDLNHVSKYLPKTGILQFYFAYKDQIYGLYDDDKKPLVIYHAGISESSALLTEEQINISLDNQGMPFDKSIKIDFKEDSELLGPQDEFYQEEFKDLFTGFDLDDEEFMTFYYEENDFSNQGSKIGGYTYFTQSDPFVSLVPDDKLLLLLQLDSDDELNMMWGDCGVANWRIFEKDLANLDFSNIVYNWDCG